MTEGFLQYGILGLVVVALGSYVLKIEARHRKEKKELMELHERQLHVQERQFDKISDITEETNKVIREHTNILAGLKSLLENQRRNGR